MDGVIHLTLLRHGQSCADIEDVHEGHYDSLLTQEGTKNAHELADNWKRQNRRFDGIVTSSLQRARTVAEIIGDTLGVPLEVTDEWKERDNGPLAGMKRDEAAKTFPKADFVNPYHPLVTSVNAGESMCEMYCRASLAIQDIIRKGPGRYLAVSHGGFLNAVMNVILGNPPIANEERVIFLFRFLYSIDLEYLPAKDMWVIERFSH